MVADQTTTADERVVVYQDFIELTCNDDDGNEDISASLADQRRNGHRFVDILDSPGIDYVGSQQKFDNYQDLIDYNYARRYSFGRNSFYSECPHCSGFLQKDKFDSETFREVRISKCQNCGWWETEHTTPEKYDDFGLRFGIKYFHRRANLKSFSVASAKVPVQNLCEYLAKRPEKLEKVDPGKLEELVGHVFRETQHCEVQYVGGPNDRGIDLYLAKGDREMVVQVKRRALRRGAEPASSVREFIGAMVVERKLNGVFVTTGSFSYFAKQTAGRALQNNAIEKIELVDGKRLIEMCDLVKPISHDISIYPMEDIEYNLAVYNTGVAFPISR